MDSEESARRSCGASLPSCRATQAMRAASQSAPLTLASSGLLAETLHIVMSCHFMSGVCLCTGWVNGSVCCLYVCRYACLHACMHSRTYACR